jgi:hypothetical protein
VLADWPMTLSDFIHTTIRPSIGEDEEIGAGWFSSGHEEEDTAGGWNVDIDIDSPLPERGKTLCHFIVPHGVKEFMNSGVSVRVQLANGLQQEYSMKQSHSFTTWSEFEDLNCCGIFLLKYM